MNPRALYTINYNEALGANSRRSMQAAADRWGVDFVEVTGPNHRVHSPASMKTLLFGELGGDRDEIFWADADTVISARCPNPFTEFSTSNIEHRTSNIEAALVVVENGGPRFGDLAQIRSAELYEWAKVRASVAAGTGVAESELPACRARLPYFNSGVMLARRAHALLFDAAEQVCRTDLGLGWHDQTPLNFWAAAYAPTEEARCMNCGDWRGKHWQGTTDLFCRSNPEIGRWSPPYRVPVHFADETWNYIHPECCLGPDWRTMSKFIYHFAGTCGRRELITTVNWDL